MNSSARTSTRTRLTQFFLMFVGVFALAMLVGTRIHPTKVHADVKAVETFECDPDTNTVVFFGGPVDLTGSSCTAAIVTLSQQNFQFQTSRGPETISREHLTAGSDDGPGHSYYLMIFWED